MFFSKYLKYSVIGLVVLYSNIFSEGFVKGTLVKTKDHYKPIEQLNVNDEVLSYKFKSKEIVPSKITQISKYRYENCVKLTINGIDIVCAPDHKFFCPLRKGGWIKAKDLHKNDFVIRNVTDLVRLNDITVIKEEADFYCLSIQDNHNYLISEQDIFVHNNAAVLYFGEVAWASFLRFLGFSTTAAVGISMSTLNLTYKVDGSRGINWSPANKDHAMRSEHTCFNEPGQDPDDWWERILKIVQDAYEEGELQRRFNGRSWDIERDQNINPGFGKLIIRGSFSAGFIRIATAFLADRIPPVL